MANAVRGNGTRLTKPIKSLYAHRTYDSAVQIMNPYSHLVIASKLEQQVVPENPSEYYWGAVAPDIRYLSKIPRRQTHLPPQEILAFVGQYPRLESFLKGYLVHCLSDEIPLEGVFFANFPFSLFKNRLSRHHLAVILELFNFEHIMTNFEVSGSYNEVLDKIGLPEDDCTKFAEFLHPYQSSSSSASSITALTQLLGLDNDTRIDKYVAAGERFQQNWLLRNILFFGIKAANINLLLTDQVSWKLKELMIG